MFGPFGPVSTLLGSVFRTDILLCYGGLCFLLFPSGICHSLFRALINIDKSKEGDGDGEVDGLLVLATGFFGLFWAVGFTLSFLVSLALSRLYWALYSDLVLFSTMEACVTFYF